MKKTRKGLFNVLAVVITALLIIGFTSICFAADEGTSSNGILSVSLSLDENITIKLRTSATYDDGSTVKVSFNGKVTVLDKNYGGVFAYAGVSPQQLGDTVTAVMCDKEGNQVGEPATFTVKSYLEALLNLSFEESGCKTEPQYSAMRELAVNMLNYGAAAQTYTDYKSETLANSDLTDEQKALATAPITVSGTDKAVNGDSWVGAGVRFDYRLGLYFVFEAESLEGLTASINGEDVTPTVYDASKNQYIIRYSSFNATNMNDVITAKLTVGDTEQTYAYSIKSYVAAKGGDESALAKLVNATYAYGYSAVAFSGKLSFVDPTFETAGLIGIDSKGYDFTGSKYESTVLPALNNVDYTVTVTSTAASNPMVESVYTFKSDKVSYSTSVSHKDCIRVNNTYYTSKDIASLNNEGVEVTYDETTGYTYHAKAPQSLAFIAAYGNALTITGDVTIVRDANNWSHYNTLNIGTEAVAGKLTVNTAGSNNWGVRLESGADMYIAEGSTMTVLAGACNYSLFGAEQGTSIVVDGTLTTAAKIRLEKAALESADYEYGFLPALYVRKGTVTIENGQLMTVCDVRCSATSYVDFRSGITVNTTGKYSHLVGGWSFAGDYRWSVHTDAKFNLSITGAIFNMGKASSYHLAFYTDTELVVDNVPAKLWIASYTYTTSTHTTPLSALVDNGDGTTSFADVSFTEGKYTTVADSSATLGLTGVFEKANYTDGEGTVHTIYYRAIN